jgi:hypothetical protein
VLQIVFIVLSGVSDALWVLMFLFFLADGAIWGLLINLAVLVGNLVFLILAVTAVVLSFKSVPFNQPVQPYIVAPPPGMPIGSVAYSVTY